MSLHLFAGLRVRDLAAARAWYGQLFGEPTFFPRATEAVWTLADDRSFYVVEAAEGAGIGVVTIFVDDLDAHVVEIAARAREHEAFAKAVYRDRDGNEVGLGGAPLDAADSRSPGRITGQVSWDRESCVDQCRDVAREGAACGAAVSPAASGAWGPGADEFCARERSILP